MDRPPLNEMPYGMLDFFGIKSMGRYPQNVGGEVLPAMDLLAWYLASKVDVGVAIATAPLVANTVAQTFGISSVAWTSSAGSFDFAAGSANTAVPNGEIWLLEHAMMAWDMSVAAADLADFALIAVQSSVAPAEVVLTDGPMLGFGASSGAVARRGSRVMSRGPMFLLPGSLLRVQCYGVTTAAGNVTWRTAVRIRRLLR